MENEIKQILVEFDYNIKRMCEEIISLRESLYGDDD